MTSDSVSSFLDLARANRVLLPDLVEDLFRQQDVPQQNLASLCDFLLNRGVITAYQANLIKSGRGYELNFAGYPVIGEGGTFVGGTIFKALHPSLRTPVVIRRIRTDWLNPADNAAAYITRAQAAAPVTHKHLANLLDAGAYGDELYVALDPVEGADLETLVRDIGPMPAPLAASYILQAAQGLLAAHDKGVSHGHVRPGCLFVGPLSPMSKTRPDGSPRMRPSSSAKVKVCELGLTPLRPALAGWLTDPAAKLEPGLEFTAPERVEAPTFTSSTPASDVYGLGATLYFLLTGKSPVEAGTNGELLTKLRGEVKSQLEALRPDAPPALSALVRGMLAKDPAARPPVSAVVDLLSALASPPGGAKPAAAPSPAEPVDLAVVPGERPVDLAPASAGGSVVSLLPSGEGSEVRTVNTPDAPAPGEALTPQHFQQPYPGYAPQPYAAWPAQDAGYAAPDTNYGWGSTDAPSYGGPPSGISEPSAPRAPKEPEKKGNLTLWLILGGTCHLLATAGIIYLLFFSGGGSDDTSPQPKPRPQQKDKGKPR
jgi:serine/threonine protein kinase